MSDSKAKKKIIIVEDKSIVSHDIKRRLEVLGYEVPGIASSGEMAIELVREHTPDLVLMDIQLEGEMDGIQAASIIKKELDIPIIYLTAFSDEGTLERAKITEPYAYIVKPFEPRELQISIEIALYKHDMETALAENKDFLDMILKNTEEGIFVLNEDFEYVYINEASGRIMGHDPKDWVGKRAGSNVHPEDADIGLKALQAMYENGKADFVARLKRSDGVYRSLHINYVQIIWQGEDHVLGVVNDITDMLEADNRLRESEEKYRSLVEEAGDGIMVIDEDATISYVNDYLLDLGGYERDDILGMEFMEFVPEKNLASTLGMFEKAINGEESPAMEMDLKKKDGSLVTVGYKGTVIFKDGEFQGIRAIIRDVSLRKQMEEALKDSEELYRTMFESSTDAVMMLDKDGFFDCNEATLYMFGLEHEKEFIGIHPSKISPPNQLDGTDSMIAANKKIQDAYDWGHNRFEWIHRRASGEDFPAEVWLTAFELKGRPVLQATVRDLTEKKKMEDELDKHREHLEKMVEETYKDLSDSEEKYRHLVERANDGIAILLDGKIIFANQKITDMLGFELEEIIDKEFMMFVPEESKGVILSNYQRRMKGEDVPAIYEVTLRKKDGSTAPVEINAGVINYEGRPADLAFIRDLTERKKSEQALISSERKYRRLTETANDAIFLADAETGKLIEANKKAELLIGRSRDEIIGMHQSKLHPPDKIEEYIQIFKKHVEEGSAISESIYVVHNDGHQIPVMISASTFELDGMLINQGIFHDMTDIRKAEAELRESEEKFRGLAEQSPNMIFINQGGRLVYVNPECETAMGYTREEFYSSDFDFMRLIHPEYIELVGKMFGMHRQGLEVQPYEYVILTKDGLELDVINSTKIITYMGEPAILGIITDISKIKKAEEDLRESEERFRQVAESAGEWIWEVDEKSIYTYSNPVVEKILGHTPEEIVGKKHIYDLYDPNTKEEDRKVALEVIGKKGNFDKFIHANIHKNGRTVYLETSGMPILDEKGDLLGYRGVDTDITERRLAEEAPLLTQFMLDRLSDAAFWMDSNAKFFYVNNAACDKLGYTREELLGMTVHDIDPNFTKEIWPGHWTDIKEKNSFTIESIHKRKDGSTYPVEVAINYIRYKNEEYNCAITRDITERKTSEKALVDRERFLANIFESIQDGLIVMDIDLKIVSTNQTVEKWFPHKIPFEGKTCNDLLHCDDLDGECICPNPDVLNSKKPEQRVIKKIGPDNTHIGWLELHSFPLYDADSGELTGVIEYIRDITEKMMVEREKLELQEFNELTIQNSPAAILTTDMDGNILTVNPALLEALDSPSAEYTKKLNVLTFQPVVEQGISKLFERCIQNGETVIAHAVPYMSSQDKSSISNIRIVPLLDSDNKQIGSMAMMDDITEQVRTEEKKEEFQNQLNAFFQASTDGIGIQKDGRFIYANPKLIELFGCDDLSEIIGTAARSYMTPESADNTKDYHDKRINGDHAPEHYEFEVLRKDGTIIDTEVSVSVYRIKDEFFAVSFIRDITELKKSREQEVQNRILEAQFEMKSVITDLIPIFLDSMGSESRASFVSNLSEKLDTVLKDRYYDEEKRNAKEVSEIYCQVLEDLGGEAQHDCPTDPMNCSNIVIKCPWSNEKTKNLILCILCRGIAWRFAQYSDQPMTVQLEHTMADGHSDCKITVSEKK